MKCLSFKITSQTGYIQEVMFNFNNGFSYKQLIFPSRQDIHVNMIQEQSFIIKQRNQSCVCLFCIGPLLMTASNHSCHIP